MAENAAAGPVARYAFLDRVGLEIEGLSRFAIADLNEKFLAFRSDARPSASIRVKIGPFVPDLAGATNVDHHYFIRKNYVYFREYLPGIAFEAEIRGLEEDAIEIRFHVLGKSRLLPANLLYPDWALHAHILQPLLECKLGMQGIFLMHAGGVAKQGKALLLIGRGGSFKTTYCFRLVGKGFDFIGDDLVMFDEGKVYPFPIHAAYFDYHLRHGLVSESDLGGLRRARMIPHLCAPPQPSFRLAAPSLPTEVILIHPRRELGSPDLKPMALATAVEKTHRNNGMERMSNVPSNIQIGNFLNAYGLVFPGHVFARHRETSLAALTRLLSRSKAWMMETSTHWDERNLALVGSRADLY